MEGLLQQAIFAFKYRNLRALAPELAGLLSEYLDSHPIRGDCLVPVPLHARRMRQRGYNQAGLLARELGKLHGLPMEEGLLRRVRDASPQVDATSRQQRKENVAGGFAASGTATGGKIILIDDVATTGSTLSACAAALKEAGASSVWALTLAREV